MEQNAISKYEFRGYRLLQAKFERMNDGPLKSFQITARKKIYDEKNQIFETITEINITFGTETSNFLFSAGFKINDLEWLEVMAEQTIVNELFQVSFPFIREKISEFTADFRPGFMIPTFDFRRFDVTKVINFNLEIKQKQPQKNNNDGGSNFIN